MLTNELDFAEFIFKYMGQDSNENRITRYWQRTMIREFSFLILIAMLNACATIPDREMKTEVTIEGEKFLINDKPTYQGITWTTSYGGEYPIEGLLMNSRMVQGIFDDVNPMTRGQWIYPDTRKWDPDRNTAEFMDAMASWRENGLLAFTLNLQGGCPYGYCGQQPWDNSAFAPDGSLRMDFMNRLERVINKADDLGMVVILGYFYFGQDDKIIDEQAVITAVENATNWVLIKGYKNVIIEINNECNVRYDHDILKCDRVHELIQLARNIEVNGRSLYVSTSLGGGSVPPAEIVAASDYVLLHGNGVRDTERMQEMIEQVREMDAYRPMPIVNNEDDRPWRDDHQGWDESGNNFVTSVKNYASWGYFDFRMKDEHNDFNMGYQSVPTNYHITTDRETAFFDLLAKITNSPGTPKLFIDFAIESGKLEVRVQDNSATRVNEVEIIVNNKVYTTLTSQPFTLEISELPEEEHWIKARARYMSSETEVTVESLYHQNPWWPYGGPRRN
jgi:hypothetical protein